MVFFMACLFARAVVICALLVAFATPLTAADYFIPLRKKNHWAWKAPVRPSLPEVKNQTWSSNPIDRFILARLEQAGLQPAPAATREQLLRRISLDLIGLPP